MSTSSPLPTNSPSFTRNHELHIRLSDMLERLCYYYSQPHSESQTVVPNLVSASLKTCNLW